MISYLGTKLVARSCLPTIIYKTNDMSYMSGKSYLYIFLKNNKLIHIICNIDKLVVNN